MDFVGFLYKGKENKPASIIGIFVDNADDKKLPTTYKDVRAFVKGGNRESMDAPGFPENVDKTSIDYKKKRSRVYHGNKLSKAFFKQDSMSKVFLFDKKVMGPEARWLKFQFKDFGPFRAAVPFEEEQKNVEPAAETSEGAQ